VDGTQRISPNLLMAGLAGFTLVCFVTWIIAGALNTSTTITIAIGVLLFGADCAVLAIVWYLTERR